jgi:hypothetical protein
VFNGYARRSQGGIDMTIVDTIMSEIEADPTIDAKEVNIVITSKGFLKRRKTLNVFAEVQSAAERNRILEIVKKQAGSGINVADKIVVL